MLGQKTVACCPVSALLELQGVQHMCACFSSLYINISTALGCAKAEISDWADNVQHVVVLLHPVCGAHQVKVEQQRLLLLVAKDILRSLFGANLWQEWCLSIVTKHA